MDFFIGLTAVLCLFYGSLSFIWSESEYLNPKIALTEKSGLATALPAKMSKAKPPYEVKDDKL